MENINKQQAGFKFGKYSTTVIEEYGVVLDDATGRKYKFLKLRTSDDNYYLAWRMYNPRGKFIKQLLFEPYLLNWFIDIMVKASNS